MSEYLDRIIRIDGKYCGNTSMISNKYAATTEGILYPTDFIVYAKGEDRCSYCGQWGRIKTACSYCGAQMPERESWRQMETNEKDYKDRMGKQF